MKSPFIFVFLTIFSSFLLNGQIKEVKETASGISRRLQHEIEMTKDPNLGYVPKFRLPKAYEVRERLLTKYSGSRSPLVWTERGPYKDIVGSSNGNTRPGVGAITSGRVRAYSYENTKYLDLDGSLDTEDPYFAGGFTIKNGYMYPNELHGLGIKHL